MFFGKTEITDEITGNSEKFLLKCISKENLDKFDDQGYELYHKKLNKFNVVKLPPTSSSVRQHTLWVYLHCHLWLHAPFIEDISKDPLQFGYMFNDKDHLASIFN